MAACASESDLPVTSGTVNACATTRVIASVETNVASTSGLTETTVPSA